MSLPRIAVVSGIAIVLAASPAFTSRRPRYGDTLIVEIGAAVSSVDPAVAPANPEQARAKLGIDSLIYDHRNPDGTFSEPGPFRVAEWDPGKHAVLAANDDYSRGRPFVDSIEIQMGRPAAERLVDVELNKADIVEIPADQARRAVERGLRVSASKLDQLIAIVFTKVNDQQPDALIREAMARSIDRPAIVNFILQKEGEPAGGLLPQWSSGTAFLFPTSPDLDRAKELRRQISAFPKIVLGYDSGDPQLQAVGERIAVNAREAGISVATQAILKGGSQANLHAHLVRLDMPSSDPRTTLMAFVEQLSHTASWDVSDDQLPGGATPQQVYDREAALIRTYSVIPIAWVPHVYAISPRVRDWTAPGPGQAWPLADVWLDRTDSQPEKGTP